MTISGALGTWDDGVLTLPSPEFEQMRSEIEPPEPDPAVAIVDALAGFSPEDITEAMTLGVGIKDDVDRLVDRIGAADALGAAEVVKDAAVTATS